MKCLICLHDIEITKDSKGKEKRPKYPEYHDRCMKELFGSLRVNPHLSFDKKTFLSEYPKQKSQGMSISGVQPKLMVSVDEDDQLQVQGKGGSYILKPSPLEYPGVCENEHVSMLLGKLFGIETPPLGLVRFSDGELAYLIKRFDRDESGEKLQQEDMAQLFALIRDEKGEYKYSKSYEEVGRFIKEMNRGNLVVTMRFFTRLIFNFLIHNGDYHLKNISLKQNERGEYLLLTPNYDSLMSRLYFPDEHELALDLLINDEPTPERKVRGYYSRPDFDELGKRLGLSDKARENIYDSFLDKEELAISLIKSSYMSDENKKEYIKNFKERLRQIED